MCFSSQPAGEQATQSRFDAMGSVGETPFPTEPATIGGMMQILCLPWFDTGGCPRCGKEIYQEFVERTGFCPVCHARLTLGDLLELYTAEILVPGESDYLPAPPRELEE